VTRPPAWWRSRLRDRKSFVTTATETQALLLEANLISA